ncbi:hypothetical protein SAMN04489806_3279 [Paramicrobacterium humi]|uniref:ATP/GTP-binding protein n=1 Tax=Paramicrobacterium humi TaxID=640635 RepID=A0A1H4TPT8_9MICO|nr:hypothetical protein [Microbacterium humi]SEC58482.1 hypothetical protein SAMN04489806_3279 [Microbacterium humi]
MPRSNRPRGRRRAPAAEPDDLSRLLSGWKRTETRRGIAWNVQPISADRALKDYVCPGCGGAVSIGTAHLVTWRADGVLGEAADLAARRHWHTHCWSIS